MFEFLLRSVILLSREYRGPKGIVLCKDNLKLLTTHHHRLLTTEQAAIYIHASILGLEASERTGKLFGVDTRKFIYIWSVFFTATFELGNGLIH